VKTIRLLAFRNDDPLNPTFAHESSLIRAGHVGIQLEGDPVIYGFHPTPEAIALIGGEDAVLDWLVGRHILDGAVFDDTAIFRRARELARTYQAPTTVYTLEYQLSDAEFDTIQAQLQEWHHTGEIFPYSWPERRNRPMLPDRDNCGTFPRRLGLAISETTGRMGLYIKAMIAGGAIEWESEE
jgi:hypothetical protein